MIVVMQGSAAPEQIQTVIEQMVELGFNVHRTSGEGQMILAGVGSPGSFDVAEFQVLPGVQTAYRISSPYKLAGKGFRPEGTVITFPNGVKVGGEEVTIMAGPCSVESREQILLSAAGEGRRRTVPARRRVQAALVAVQLPGHGRRRPQAAA